MIYKTHAIIIKRSNLGEADRIVTLFSEKFGKIKAIAKGIRKINSKLSGNVELFCLSNFNLAEGRNLDVVTAAIIEKCYLNLRNNLSATRHAHYFAELTDKLTEERDPHPEIFNLLDEVLENLDNHQSILLTPFFEWNLLTYLGYRPELFTCAHCRKKMSEDEEIYFDVYHSGIICSDCRRKKQKSEMTLAMTSNQVKILRLFLKHQIERLRKIDVDKKTLDQIQKITRTYLTSKSDKEFKSQKFLK